MANDGEQRYFDPHQRVGFDAFLEAREADPLIPPEEFAPNHPQQAEWFWNSVKNLLDASRHDDDTVTDAKQSTSVIREARRKEFLSRPNLVHTTIGHYHVRRVIASGGMGTVYQAVQENPRRIVALKVMRPGLSSQSALRACLKRIFYYQNRDRKGAFFAGKSGRFLTGAVRKRTY